MNEKRPRVAVDMDSTLAAIAPVASNRVADGDRTYTYEDHTEWDWPIDSWGDAWLEELWDVWRSIAVSTDDPDVVDPMEPNLSTTIDQLWAAGFVVDVVTHHPSTDAHRDAPRRETRRGASHDSPRRGTRRSASPDSPHLDLIAAGKQDWLDAHDISYDELVVVREGVDEKATLDDEYVAFIDDSPHVLRQFRTDDANAKLFLRTLPFNDHLELHRRQEQRVDTVYEAVGSLLGEADWHVDVYGSDETLAPSSLPPAAPRETTTDDGEQATTPTPDADDSTAQQATDTAHSGDEKAGQLARDVGALITDSRDSHGDAVANQRHIAAAWRWYLQGMYDTEIDLDGSDVARMMELLKLSRACVGEYDIDHDRDVVGYAAIAGACAVDRGDADESALTTFTETTDHE